MLVLCYHAVSDDWPAPLALPAARLEEQVALLLDRGYVATTFTEAVLAPPARRTLAVTFDDAFGSVLDRGLPVLDRLGVPATTFVPTDFPGRARLSWSGIEHWAGTAHEDELRPLSWDELRRLADAGWEIGSHTRSHPRLTRLDDGAVRGELSGSRDECERRLGRPCTSIAYPYGDVDARVVDAAAAVGYLAGAALPERIHEPRRLEWPRMGVFAADRPLRLRVKMSPLGRRLIGVPAGEALLHLEKRVRRRLSVAARVAG